MLERGARRFSLEKIQCKIRPRPARVGCGCEVGVRLMQRRHVRMPSWSNDACVEAALQRAWRGGFTTHTHAHAHAHAHTHAHTHTRHASMARRRETATATRVFVCVRACVRACVRSCACVCVAETPTPAVPATATRAMATAVWQ